MYNSVSASCKANTPEGYLPRQVSFEQSPTIKTVTVSEGDEVALLLAPRPCIEEQRKQNTHSSRGGKQQTVATHTTRSKKKHGDFTRTLPLTTHNNHALSFLFLSCFITVFLSSLRNKYKNTKRSSS